jgi:G8 domain/K319L-like, PKD domain
MNRFNSSRASLRDVRYAPALLALGFVVLTSALPVAQRDVRPGRPEGGQSRLAQPSGRNDQRRSSELPRPMMTAGCQDASHDADHKGVGPAGGPDEQMRGFCSMFPRGEATHTAAASGPWSSPKTWNAGRLPAADAKVLVPEGVTVTVDRELSAPLSWIRVEGALRFDAGANTAVVVDTLKVEYGGRLEIGTAAKPIPAGLTAQVVIAARAGQPIDQSSDPFELSRGVIAQGIVEIHGAAKTPFVSVSEAPRMGTASIVADQPPAGWLPGDALVLTASEYDQDETFKLVRVEGTTIVLDHPIRNARALPAVETVKGWSNPAFHLGNLTRNVQIRSETASAGDPKRQGHVMLIHRGGHKISWVGFYDLGRTTVRPVTDPTIQDGRRDAGISAAAGITAENIRGRYSLHFHGAGPTVEASQVEGCVVQVKRGAGFKLGIANHSSNVIVRGCVSHNIDGSHYFTEEGDEIGEFSRNLAIHSVGSGTSHDEQPRDVDLKNDPALHQRRRLDVGHRGTGFWLNGGGVDVIDNVSAGQAHSGFNLWARPLNHRLANTYVVRFPVAYLRDRTWANSADSVPIENVPIRFNGNVAYVLGHARNGGEGGFIFEYHGIATKSRFPDAPYSELYNLLSWNAGGIKASYAGNFHLKNARVIGQSSRTEDVGARLGIQGSNGALIENLRVEGFPRGVTLPTRSIIKGGFFATNLGIPVGANQDTTIDLTDMKFGPVAPAVTGPDRVGGRGTGALPRRMQYDLYVQPILTGHDFNPAIAFAAQQPTIVRGHPQYPQGAQLYSLEQMPDYVLPDLGIPGLLDGSTTTGEAWEKYRLAPGGAIAPPGASPLPSLRSNGVFGAPTAPASSQSPRSARREGQLGGRDRAGVLPDRQRTRVQSSADARSQVTREQLKADREQRVANEASRRANLQQGGPLPQDQAASADARRNRADRPSSQDRVRGSRQPQSPDRGAQTPDVASGPAWQLVPQPGGNMALVQNGSRSRPPTVGAGGDQTVQLSEGVALQGVVGDNASVRWTRAYGPGSVVFADPASAQTRARFSAPGIYVLHLTVQDAVGRKNTAPVTVTVAQSQ